MGGKPWGKDEIAILKKHGPQIEIESILALLDRTPSAIAAKAYRLGIRAFRRCEDCGTLIDIKSRRCNGCAKKAVWATEESRNRIIKSQKQFWVNEENRKRRSKERNANEEWRRKHGEAIKVAWTRGDYDSEKTRRKMGEATKVAWERGDFDEERNRKVSEGVKAARRRGAYDGIYNDEWRRKHGEAMKAAWARGAYDGVVIQSPTSIELEVAAALDIMGIKHQSQYRPEGYRRIYDEFVPPSTLIEIHGDYWHGDDFPEQQQRDAEKAVWAEENGYQFITIWEHEIRNYGAWAIIMQNAPLLTRKER